MAFKWTELEFERVSKEMYRLMTSGRSSVLEHWPAFKLAQSLVNPIYKYSTNFPNQKLMAELKKRVSGHFNDASRRSEVKVVLDQDAAQAKARAILSKLSPTKVTTNQVVRSKTYVDSTESRVKSVIAEQMNLGSTSEIHAATTMFDLGADSLDLLEVVMGLEEEFDIEIPDHDAIRLLTVQHAVDYILYKKLPNLPEPKISMIRTLLTGNQVQSLETFVKLPDIITNCPRKFVLVDLETGEQFGVEDNNWCKPIRRVVIPKPQKK